MKWVPKAIRRRHHHLLRPPRVAVREGQVGLRLRKDPAQTIHYEHFLWNTKSSLVQTQHGSGRGFYEGSLPSMPRDAAHQGRSWLNEFGNASGCPICPRCTVRHYDSAYFLTMVSSCLIRSLPGMEDYAQYFFILTLRTPKDDILHFAF